MRSWALVAVCVSLVGVGSLAACTVSGTDGSGGSGGGSSSQNSSSATTGQGTTTSNTTTTATTTTGGGEDCSLLATYAECDDCECANHTAGCDNYIGFEDQECACKAGAPCETACATYCGGGEFDAACEACFTGLTGDEACYVAAEAACEADADCNAYVTATDASCSALP